MRLTQRCRTSSPGQCLTTRLENACRLKVSRSAGKPPRFPFFPFFPFFPPPGALDAFAIELALMSDADEAGIVNSKGAALGRGPP